MAATKRNFVVVQSDGTKVNINAERAEQDKASSRVTFYNGEESVASFINIQSWYEAEK